MKRPASITFYGAYFLVLSIVCIVWGVTHLPALAALGLVGWGLWAGFCSVGLFLHDDPCRRGLVWIAGLDIAASFVFFLFLVNTTSLEAVFGNLGRVQALFVVNLALSFAALFVLSNSKAREYCHADDAAHVH